jgi:hypothetical protein
MYRWNGDYYDWAQSSPMVPPNDAWSLVALTVEPTRATLSMRTTQGLITQVNVAPHGVQSFDGVSFLGYDTGGSTRYFNGGMDEVRFYNRTLTNYEIEQIYQSGLNNASSPRPTGVTAAYFNGTNFQTPVVLRLESQINYDWGLASAAPGVNADNFSVRWTGCLVPRYTETTTFHIRANKGFRLTVGDQQIINNWSGSITTEVTGTAALVAGIPMPFRLEYFDDVDTARCEFYWSSASQTKEIVPMSRMMVNETSALPGTPIVISSPEDQQPRSIAASALRAMEDLPRANQSMTLETSSDDMLNLIFTRLADMPENYVLEVSDDLDNWQPIPDQHWSIRRDTFGFEEVRVPHACCILAPRSPKSWFRLRVITE